MKNVKVLIGNYGSGKSELALNFAMQAAARGDKTELIDLDMVNTYFRLTERGRMVEQKEIRLVSPNYACSGIETLSLPAEVASAFVLDWDTVIFDVGGDDVGATALGRYHQDFAELEDGPHAQDQDPDENVYPVVMTAAEIEEAIRKGTIFDSKTLSAWIAYKLIVAD